MMAVTLIVKRRTVSVPSGSRQVNSAKTSEPRNPTTPKYSSEVSKESRWDTLRVRML